MPQFVLCMTETICMGICIPVICLVIFCYTMFHTILFLGAGFWPVVGSPVGGPVCRFLFLSSGGLLEWGHLCNSCSGLGCPGLVDVWWLLSGALFLVALLCWRG